MVVSDIGRKSLSPPFSPVNSKASNIRANFENLAKEKEAEDRRRAEAERAQRMAKERREQEEARRQLEVTLRAPGRRSGREQCPREAGRLCSAAAASGSWLCAFSQDPHCVRERKWARGGGDASLLRRSGG